MNRSAHRGDSLTWKTTAMAAALVALVAAAALLSACAEDKPNGAAGQFAVASPAIPQKAAEDDPDSWLNTLEENPVDQAFVDSLSAFAYRSSASVLGGDASADAPADTPANRT